MLIHDQSQELSPSSVTVSGDSQDSQTFSQVIYIAYICRPHVIRSQCNEDSSLLYSNTSLRAVRLVPVEKGGKVSLIESALS